MTLSWCTGPNGSGHREQTGKRVPAAKGGSGCLKFAEQTAFMGGGGADCLKLPDDAGPTARGLLRPVTLPSRDSMCRGCLFAAVAASPTARGPVRPVVLPSRASERRRCLYVPPPLLHHSHPFSLHPVALLRGTHSVLPLVVELPLGE